MDGGVGIDVAGAIAGWLARSPIDDAERCEVFVRETARKPRYTIVRRSGTNEWALEHP
jgi:hypothetical protein